MPMETTSFHTLARWQRARTPPPLSHLQGALQCRRESWEVKTKVKGAAATLGLTPPCARRRGRRGPSGPPRPHSLNVGGGKGTALHACRPPSGSIRLARLQWGQPPLQLGGPPAYVINLHAGRPDDRGCREDPKLELESTFRLLKACPSAEFNFLCPGWCE